jgi:hypothetical protein
MIAHTYKSLLNSHTFQYNQARLLAAAAVQSGDWLHAVPISACGLHYYDESLRVTVGLRGKPSHGALVDARGSRALFVQT